MAAKTENAVFPASGFEVRMDDNGVETLWVQVTLKDCEVVYNPLDIMPGVQERIETGKKPAGVLSKEVGRVALHIEQVNDAMSNLFTTYHRMISAPPKKLTVAYRARYALLDSMKPKLLKEYARDYLPDEVDNFILSDEKDREALIHRLCGILVEEKEETETVDSMAE